MVNVAVEIISRENIKPDITANLKPYNLCLLDQLTPTVYMPLIFFYTNTETNFSPTQFLTHLKKSLKQTLAILYPFSGRVRENMFIDRFDKGVPFVEANVNCSLFEFFDQSETELLNRLLPYPPCTRLLGDEVPLIGFQVSIFSCGGIAIGFPMSHKIGDGNAASVFLSILAATSQLRSFPPESEPDFNSASLLFPPRNPCPEKLISSVEGMWFKEDEYVTRRFIFDAQVIDRLRNKAKGEGDQDKPSRVQAVSGFLWKCYLAASNASSASPTPCIFRQAVDLRLRTIPRLPPGALGNLILAAEVETNPQENLELHEVVKLMRQSIGTIDYNMLKTIQGKEGFEALSLALRLQGEKLKKEKMDSFLITSWCNFDLEHVDFGIGKPVWVCSFGKVGPEFTRFATLIQNKWKGIEAWLNLDVKRMNALENVPEFLAYASPCLKLGPKPSNLSSLL